MSSSTNHPPILFPLPQKTSCFTHHQLKHTKTRQRLVHDMVSSEQIQSNKQVKGIPLLAIFITYASREKQTFVCSNHLDSQDF